MFSEKYGVNTMKAIFRSFLFLIILGYLFVIGCSNQSNKAKTASDATGNQKIMTLKDTIEDVLNEAMTRLRYGDKSGLYENEFSYLKDTTTFDDYLKTGQMQYASNDSLSHIDVNDVELFNHDSARVKVTVNFEGPSGKKHSLDDKITVYYHKGRWIKPTISVIKHELEYENMIHQAESAAAAEAQSK
ncbi:MAG: hypothetical protein GXO93_04145 [FCB group bacterium]|nr:hypothetical protein [FCB group bacterium]